MTRTTEKTPKYLLSILIPTKNRYQYLERLVLLIKSFRSQDIELVIQDNSDNNISFVSFLNENYDERIKYFYQDRYLSIIDNMILSINNSSGKYLCCLGDDDGIVEELINWVRWMDENSVDSLFSNNPVYFWPDHKSNYHNFSGTIKIKKYSSETEFIDAQKELVKVIKKGGTSMERLPRLYHGVVSRTILEKIYLKTGTYIPGPSPDMASAVAISLVVKKFAYIDLPLIISGSGFKSSAGAGARHQNIKRIEDVFWLPLETKNSWESKNPKVWTGPTIWAESVIKALRAMDQKALLLKFNYSYLYARFVVFYHTQFKELRKVIPHKFFYIPIFYYALFIFSHRLKTFLINFVKSKTKNINNSIMFTNVADIIMCSQKITKLLKSKNSNG